MYVEYLMCFFIKEKPDVCVDSILSEIEETLRSEVNF
jgi:hypothetical protein